MKKIIITGQSGFIGSHLAGAIKKLPEEFALVDFQDSYFEDSATMKSLVADTDVILHLAALNRHSDPSVIYDVNISLVQKLINACEETNKTPHIIFSSSTQEERDNSYGNSKKEGRELLIKWSKKNNAPFTGLIIPNVFGPNSKPFYNTVVATFCYQLVNDQTPKIEIDAELKLIYINELIEEIIKIIKMRIVSEYYLVNYSSVNKVSEILKILHYFKETYLIEKRMPLFKNSFEKNLFDTFISFIK